MDETGNAAEVIHTFGPGNWIWPCLVGTENGDRVQFTRDVWDADGYRRQIPDTEFLVLDRGPDFVRARVYRYEDS